MMREVYVLESNIISPLGNNTADNFYSLKDGKSGVTEISNERISPTPFFASLFPVRNDDLEIFNPTEFTKFETLIIKSLSDVIDRCEIDPKDPKTVLIISSTKGNIELIENTVLTKALAEKVSLSASAQKIATNFGFQNMPIVVSTACISGVSALISALRLIQSGKYDHAFVVGGDLISKFILSGFQSFQALSHDLCRPFDKKRNGINLGEAAGTLLLSCNKSNNNHNIKITGGSTSNDANHISGPSRTGEELNYAIQQTLKQAGVQHSDINLISAHGTATIYNDEMEAKAIHLSKLENVPINSLKGYWGHTLGAAGILESIATIESMKVGILLPTLGFEELGVSVPVNVCTKLEKKILNNCLKTISGFGGCNAALLFSIN